MGLGRGRTEAVASRQSSHHARSSVASCRASILPSRATARSPILLSVLFVRIFSSLLFFLVSSNTPGASRCRHPGETLCCHAPPRRRSRPLRTLLFPGPRIYTLPCDVPLGSLIAQTSTLRLKLYTSPNVWFPARDTCGYSICKPSSVRTPDTPKLLSFRLLMRLLLLGVVVGDGAVGKVSKSYWIIYPAGSLRLLQ